MIDYNGDGRLDLLVGDYSSITPLRKLSASEKSEVQKLIQAKADAAQFAKFTTKQSGERPPSSFVWYFERNAEEQ